MQAALAASTGPALAAPPSPALAAPPSPAPAPLAPPAPAAVPPISKELGSPKRKRGLAPETATEEPAAKVQCGGEGRKSELKTRG